MSLILVGSITLLLGELFARYVVGLGTPPLTIPHDSIEYLYAPNQNVIRFGNRFSTNAFGMRSSAFRVRKKDSAEYRVMVFGDSVVNGGNLTDQNALATTKMDTILSQQFRSDVVVGNISAGTWGPGNWLAYVNKFGFFDADTVVLVTSSHDYSDNPIFEPLNKNTHPTRNPPSALLEGIIRYIPRYLEFGSNDDSEIMKNEILVTESSEKAIQKATNDLQKFLKLAQINAKNVLVFQHWEKTEIESGMANPGFLLIREVCKSVKINTISLKPIFEEAIRAGKDPYRDNIHLSDFGQKLLADAVLFSIAKFTH